MGFEQAWNAVADPRDGETVSPQLQPLLRDVYEEAISTHVELRKLKSSLIALLSYLNGPGRTNANCWAADLFFSTDHWEPHWADQNLPEEFHELMGMMGEALHDTVKSPGIAQNFGCAPEQLLERALTLPT